MKLYGGRLIRNTMNRNIANRSEMRDAVVMSVDQTNKYAIVKIQGSNVNIKARYPENWESTPNYLKPGNAVRLNQPSGNKGVIQIMGMGMHLPTAIAGGSVTPVPAAEQNAVLTGMEILATNPASLTVLVNGGTYRIDAATYTFSGLQMDDAGITMDMPNITMDDAPRSVTFDAAHATYYRYDSLFVGTDGEIDIVKGSNCAITNITAVPTTVLVDHLYIGYVLIPPACTQITEAMINKPFNVPVATSLYATVGTVTGELLGPYQCDVTIGIKDQYGNFIRNTAGWIFQICNKYNTVTVQYGDTNGELPAATLVYTDTDNLYEFTNKTAVPGVLHCGDGVSDWVGTGETQQGPILYITEVNTGWIVCASLYGLTEV